MYLFTSRIYRARDILNMISLLPRSNSANRSLPDIPKDRSTTHETRNESTFPDVIYEATETTGDPSELYATVQDKNIQQRTYL